MNQEFQIVIQNITYSENPSDIWQNVMIATKMLGFQHCAYGQKNFMQKNSSPLTMINTYSEEWNSIYEKERILTRDPVVNTGLITSEPILWDDVYQKDEELWEMSKTYGLKHGWSKSSFQPSGLASLFSVCRSHEPLTTKEIKFKTPFLQWLATVAIQGLSKNHQPSGRCLLSNREKEVMSWSSFGKTSYEISIILGLSERTVNWHVNNAIAKLAVNNKTSAVAKAVRLNLV
jgi:DNA-binding CsgD family transcriptional regulator